MSRECVRNSFYQEWTAEGKLKANMNLTLNELLSRMANDEEEVYAYVLTTLKNMNGEFAQCGCGPNFQGGLITLCTCKYSMRTWRERQDWKGAWIAGFSGINLLGDKKSYLFYLMKVSKSFLSHKEIWDDLTYARFAKDARINPLGDIYEPRHDIVAQEKEFDFSNYYPPIETHVHFAKDRWHKDICYQNRFGKRRPTLLVGDERYSFLWRQPVIYFDGKHPRTKKWKIEEFKKRIKALH